MSRGAGLRPLADLKGIAVERYGTAPFGTLHLARLGAEVIEIENLKDGGDATAIAGLRRQGIA